MKARARTSGAHPHPGHDQGAGCGWCPDVPPRRLEQARQMSPSQNEPALRHRVVIVGGGFGGLQAARRLRRAPVDVTLIDRRNFHLFQPLLYQVATGAAVARPRSPSRCGRSSAASANVRVMLGEVVGLRPRAPPRARSTVADRRDDAAVAVRHADRRRRLPLLLLRPRRVARSRPRSRRSRARSRSAGGSSRAFEAAELEPDPARRAAWLTFVVVGAGPTGVEMAGQIAEIARDTLRRDFRAIDPGEARILLVEPADRVPAQRSRRRSPARPDVPSSASASPRCSAARWSTSTPTASTLRPRAGAREVVPARTAIWAAGVGASPLAAVLAAGDRRRARPRRPGHGRARPLAARAPRGAGARRHGARADADGEARALPGIAPVAMQQGRYAARLVRDRLRGGATPPFRYVDKGNLATIGRATRGRRDQRVCGSAASPPGSPGSRSTSST